MSPEQLAWLVIADAAPRDQYNWYRLGNDLWMHPRRYGGWSLHTFEQDEHGNSINGGETESCWSAEAQTYAELVDAIRRFQWRGGP